MIEEQLRGEIAALIMGGEVKDPRVGPFVSVTRVEASRDVSTAKVYVSSFGAIAADPEGASSATNAGVPADDGLSEAVAGLQSAAGFIQAHVAKRVRLRLTPKLHFLPDRGIRDGFEMNEKIRNLVR